MSIYSKLADIGSHFVGQHILFKHGFNWSPMYRRSTAKITQVSKDMMKIDVRLPISWKNRNYANTIFGGSMFSAVDPIPMVQLITLLGKEYVVWDRSAVIRFKRPAKETIFATFECSQDEIEVIKERVRTEHEIDIQKLTQLKDKNGKLICEVEKTIYIADKGFYKKKKQRSSG